MQIKRTALLVPLAAAVALITGLAAAGTAPITITSPANGSSVSLKKNPSLTVAGTVAFAATTAGSTRFYLRRDGCGTSNDNPHLSIAFDPNKPDGGDGCGLIVNAVAGPGGDADQAAFVDFPSTDGMPLTLDASHPITGVIVVDNFSGGAGAGDVIADVSMEALVNGIGVPLGSDSESALAVPGTADETISFTINPALSLDKTDLSGIDLRDRFHGPYVLSGFLATSGRSFVNVPSYAASFARSVKVSLDNPTFANPVAAMLNASASGWSTTIATPALGKHTIYAEATQGFNTTAPASGSFTVKR